MSTTRARPGRQDRASLLEIMSRLEVRPRLYKRAGGWLAEKVRRVKLNGAVGTRSPLTSLIELELLQLGSRARQPAGAPCGACPTTSRGWIRPS